MKRVFLVVLDSLGAGALPDAAEYGDEGCGTIRSISQSYKFHIPNLLRLGLGNVNGLSFLGKTIRPAAASLRLAEQSKGKDTTIGHWEISGVVSDHPLPTYPEGFPMEILDELERQTGRGWLCNKPYSGTEVIKDYGEEHIRTGKVIVYTSADSVLQIAAHNDVVPLDELYDICAKARAIMQGEHGVGRVIARPFVGKPGDFTRTGDRRDYSIEAPGRTILDVLSREGFDVISVGKIKDVFVGRGITEIMEAHNNSESMAALDELVEKDFHGLCFANLVDFDMLYGHRNDIHGYANALSEFDHWLGGFLPKLREDDVLMITADHGCDPGDVSTDHTREYIPLLVYGKEIAPLCLPTRESFADIADTIAEWFDVPRETKGRSFARLLRFGRKSGFSADDRKRLVDMAVEAMGRSYSPYSGCTVGAALLAENGRIYTGCNIENAAYGPSVCAERTAVFKAVSMGVSRFVAIAVVGGRNGVVEGEFPPCGVCRQVLMEFCDPKKFRILLVSSTGVREVTLEKLLPWGFGPDNLWKK